MTTHPVDQPAAEPSSRSAAKMPSPRTSALETATALVPAQASPVDTQVDVQVSAPVAPQIVIQVEQRGLFVRALYYLFVGWWLSGLMMFAAGVCIASVVLLPAGLAMVNRLPQVMTLRPRSTAVNAAVLSDGSMQYTVGSAQQRSMLVRAVYFCLVGWWAGMVVMFVAWVLSVLIVTMPLGLMLLNRVPAAVTLRRN